MALLSPSATNMLALVAILTLTYVASNIIYNLFLHPLRKFPGPILWRATCVPNAYKVMQGVYPFEMLNLHQKYGEVVRINPDELAFCNSRAWKDIMGHRTAGPGGGGDMEKAARFYKVVPESMSATSVVTAEREDHARIRRLMTRGFSDRSMREQEPIIKKYVDLLIRRLQEHGDGGKKAIDIMSWYNYTTFDVIGDLAFGEPFGCLDKSDYHPWVRAIFDEARVGMVLQVLSQFPMVKSALLAVLARLPESVTKEKMMHRQLTKAKLLRRMELDAGRPDLIEGLIKKQKEWNMPMENLQANAGILIIGGSETTATLLSGVTYLLLMNPDKMKNLVEEVRSTFKSEAEIDFVSVSNLSYMLACLDEALRIYPPAATGLPRITPKGGANICDYYVPEDTIVSIHHYACYHNEAVFADPGSFHPERWLGDPRFATDDKEMFQPFQTGPRGCIGRNLAYVEMRLILARLIWNFDLSIADDSVDWMGKQKVYILWQKGPLNVYLTPVVRD